MTFHAVSLVVGRSAGWSVNLCIDCVRPLFELRPPGSSLACNSPPFSPEEKNLCPPSLQTTPLPAKYAALSQLSSPFFFFSLRTLFLPFSPENFYEFSCFFPPFFFFFLCSEGKERNTYSSHFAVPPSIIFSCGAAFIFSRLSHSLLPFSLFIFFFFYLVHQHLAASFLPSSGRLIFPFCA